MSERTGAIVASAVKHPQLTPADLARRVGNRFSHRGRDIRISTDEVESVLTSLGLDHSSEFPKFVLDRWGWEAIIANEIANYAGEPSDTWVKKTASQLVRTGATGDGARIWVQEFIRQFQVRKAPDFQQDMQLLRYAANSNIFLLPDPNLSLLEEVESPHKFNFEQVGINAHKFDIERVARFAAWTTLRLLVGLNPSVTRMWSEGKSASGIDVNDTHLGVSWVLFALGQAMPGLNVTGRLVDTIGDETRRMLKQSDFNTIEIQALYRQWWSTEGGLPASAGWTRLRDVCPSLAGRAERVIKEYSDSWSKEWGVLSATRPKDHIARNSTFCDKRTLTALLESQTGLFDEPKQRRCFAWTLLTVFEEVLVEAPSIDSVEGIIERVALESGPGISISEQVVQSFLVTHGCHTPSRLQLLKDFLATATDRSKELSSEDRQWLTERLALITLREAIAADLSLDKTFDSKFSVVLDRIHEPSSGLGSQRVHDMKALNEVLNSARELMGISDNHAKPHGVDVWQDWFEIHSPLHPVPIRERVRKILRTSVVPLSGFSSNQSSWSGDKQTQLSEQLAALAKLQDSVSASIASAKSVLLALQEVEQWLVTSKNDLELHQLDTAAAEHALQLEGLVRTLQLKNRQLQNQSESAEFLAKLDVIRQWNRPEGFNSTLNRLYRWAHNHENDDLRTSAIDLLQRLRSIDVRAEHQDRLGQIVPLDNLSARNWQLMPGLSVQNYNGRAEVITPEWWFQDQVLERALVYLAENSPE